MNCPSESAGVLPVGDKRKSRRKGGVCPSPSFAIATSDLPRRATRASALGLSCSQDKRGQTVVLCCHWDFTKALFSQSSCRCPRPHTRSKKEAEIGMHEGREPGVCAQACICSYNFPSFIHLKKQLCEQNSILITFISN